MGVDRERSKESCSASVRTAALDALYAGFPGGLVIPCLEPVMIIEVGFEAVECSVARGKRAARNQYLFILYLEFGQVK